MDLKYVDWDTPDELGDPSRCQFHMQKCPRWLRKQLLQFGKNNDEDAGV